jgi:ribosomal protein S18 acetylase RimI-like enzyme
MVVIRPYTEPDWAAICAIHDAARPDELRGSCDPRAFVPIEQDAEVEDLRRSDKYVAVHAGRVVGFVGVDDKYLAWLYVHPEYYGRGIGRRLLTKGLEVIGDGAWTIVLDGNKRAIQLYESAGLHEVRRYQSDNAGYPCTCLRLARD